MKMYGGVDVQTQGFLTSALIGGERVSFTLQPLKCSLYNTKYYKRIIVCILSCRVRKVWMGRVLVIKTLNKHLKHSSL
jgi:hypothetical protein